MERHTNADASHSEFTYTRLEEATGKVIGCDDMGMFEEAVGLVRVAEIGRRYNHIADMLREEGEGRSRSGTGSDIVFLLEQAPV